MSLPVRLCLTSLVLVAIGSFAEAADPPPPPPLRYYIGHELVVVSVTSTTKVTRKIEKVSGGELDRCQVRRNTDPELCVTETSVTTREGTVGTQLVPEPALAADVGIGAKLLIDDQLSLDLKDGMLLKGINVKSTGRAPDLVAAIAKFSGMMLARVAFGGVGKAPVPTVAPTACDPFKRPFLDLPDTVRLFVSQNAPGCTDWQTLDDLRKAQDARVKDRLQLEHEIRGATGAELTTLLKKLETVSAAIAAGDEDIKKRQPAFTAAADAFTAAQKLGTVTTTDRYDQTMRLSDLPPSTGLSAGMAEDAVKIDGFPEAAKELWKASKLVVALDPVVAPTCAPAVTMPDQGKGADDKTMKIYFRQAAPARMRAFVADHTATPDKSTLRSVADRFDNFVHPCLPISVMAFQRSVWATRALALSFDDKGRPSRVERTAQDSAAAIAASVSSASTAFRDEVATTVAKMVDIQGNRRKLDMEDLLANIERTKSEKELLDQQLALDSTGQNYEAALKQKQAVADLAKLQAEVALSTAQSAREQNTEIAVLKLELEQVKAELELVKARQELEKVTRK